jgi:hypothetical protein
MAWDTLALSRHFPFTLHSRIAQRITRGSHSESDLWFHARLGTVSKPDNRILRLGSGGEKLETGLSIPGTYVPQRMPLSSAFHGEAQEWDHTGFAARWTGVLTILLMGIRFARLNWRRIHWRRRAHPSGRSHGIPSAKMERRSEECPGWIP